MRDRFHFDLDYWTIIFGLLLCRLPVFLGYSQSLWVNLLCQSPFIVVIIKNFILLLKNKKIYRFNPQLLIVFVLYFLGLGVGALRSALSDDFSFTSTMGKLATWFIYASFAFLVFTRINEKDTVDHYSEAIGYGLIFYVVINVLAYFIGFQNQEEMYLSPRPALMLQYMNVSVNRVSFPFSGGINTFGFISGAAFYVSSLLLFGCPQKKNKVIGTLGAVLSLVAILLTDSRGALLFAVTTTGLAVIFPSRFVKYWRWLPLILPFLPLAAIFIQKFIPYETIEGLLRNTTTTEVNVLSGRPQIWDLILGDFGDFQFTHLIGYGYHGQIASGLSQQYAFLFSNFIYGESASAHNFLLQTLLDIGYLGLILVFWLMILLMFTLAKLIQKYPKDPIHKNLFFLFFYLVLSGTTETVFTPDHLEFFVVFILIWAAAGVSSQRIQISQVNAEA